MPQFRMPFTSRKPPATNGTEPNDENTRPSSHSAGLSSPYQNGDKPSVALNQKERRQEPNEFKLSSVDPDGQYLPPSPTEKKAFWASAKSPSSSNHRSLLSENEPFSISRESFDSYRRSFDISGRSPIIQSDSFTSRTSLDSRNLRLPRASLQDNTYEAPARVEDTNFEDVKLTDDTSKQQPKKRSFLSRFADSSNDPNSDGKSHHFHIGRKRGQSGTGAELGEVNRPDSKGNNEVTVR